MGEITLDLRRVRRLRVRRGWIILILLSGRAKSGKSTVAAHLVRTYGFTEVSLADALKEATKAAFGFTDDQVRTQEGKAAVDGWWGFTPRLALQLVGSQLWQFAFPKALKKAGFKKYPRTLPGGYRPGSRAFWCLRLWKEIGGRVANGERIVVADGRFPVEIEFFKDALSGNPDTGLVSPVCTVRIDRKCVVPKRSLWEKLKQRLGLAYYPDLHMSETALDKFKFDYTLDSNRNVEDLLFETDILFQDGLGMNPIKKRRGKK